jgi:hypothetical protein
MIRPSRRLLLQDKSHLMLDGEAEKACLRMGIGTIAISDAMCSAERNRIGNATFIGKVKDQLAPVLLQAVTAGARIVCVVQPPRGGLHPRDLKAIRACTQIEWFVSKLGLEKWYRRPAGFQTRGN